MAYSEGEKAEALVRLAATGHDFEAVSAEVGIPARTLRRWSKPPEDGDVEGARWRRNATVADLLGAALEKVLAAVPEDLSGVAWATTVGILVDKWLALQGLGAHGDQPLFEFGMRITGMSDEEYWRVLREAERRFEDLLGVGGAVAVVEPPAGSTGDGAA